MTLQAEYFKGKEETAQHYLLETSKCSVGAHGNEGAELNVSEGSINRNMYRQYETAVENMPSAMPRTFGTLSA